MKFATRYEPPLSPSINFVEPSKTDQSQAKDCDINFIIDRCRKTGYLVDPLHPGTRVPSFGDYTDIPDYQGCLDVVMHAQDAFAALPAKVRDRFGNDPAQLLAFLSDASNRDEAIRLGLIDPSPVDSASDVKQVSTDSDVKPVVKSADKPAEG